MFRLLPALTLWILLFESAAHAQQSRPIPAGFMNAAPAEELMEAWAGKSLWIPNAPFMGGGTCFDFHAWDDCRIASFDAAMQMSDKNGRLCEVKEYIVIDSPGMQPGGYGLIVMGVGTSYNYDFLEVIEPNYTSFTPRNGDGPWEISEEPCSARAK